MDQYVTSYSHWLKKSGFILLTLLLVSCSNEIIKPSEPEIVYETPINSRNKQQVKLYPTEFAYLPRWQEDNHAQAYRAFQRSCRYWNKLKSPKTTKMAGIFHLGTIADWLPACQVTVIQGTERQFFERYFKPYAVSNGDSFKGLFTGYYVPQLRGSHTKTRRFNVPVYGKPDDLIKQGKKMGREYQGRFIPYYDRNAIYNGALARRNLELLWVDDAVDAFFMEIQGSGRVLMPDGSLQGLGYAAKNGQPYFAIGRALVDSGAISKQDISMQTIRAWIQRNPAEGRKLMRRNRSFIFFRKTEIKQGEGAVGAMNEPLTQQRSLAIDRSHLPLGIPIWLDAEHPTQKEQRLQQLVMAQDTGGAIKGAIRGDFYWGEGKQAGELAGKMKSAGRYFLLIPRGFYEKRLSRK